ncbi:MAG: DUF3568 family protein [Syntrophales bacterium]|nr:DUF3568 family protein [Syntrophales bacterium]
MRKSKVWLFWSVAIVFLTSGCELLLIGGIIGGGAVPGTYFYVKGELQADYSSSFDTVWTACEKTMADMRAADVKPYKEIGSGTLAAVINGEDVKFTVKYKAKNVTTVAIRVGNFGNKNSSQLLHDKIGDNLR